MLESMLSSPATELQASLNRNFRDLQIELGDVQRKEIGGLAVVVARAAITRQAGDDGTSSSSHSVVYFQAPDAAFPRFALWPMGPKLRLVSMFGLRGMTFADQPEFSNQYLVLTLVPLRAQPLFRRDVRDWLLAHPGMHVEAGGGGVLVYGPDGVLHGAELERFAGNGAELVRLLDRARGMAVWGPRQPSELEEARALAAQMPGFLRRTIGKDHLAHFVTRAELDAFLRQSPPRKIPKNIAYSYEFSSLLSGMGLLFMTGPGVMAYAAAVTGKWDVLALATGLFLVGATLIFFGVPKWLRHRRLLRHGELAFARILGVEPAGITVNDQEIYTVTAQCVTAGQSRQVECRAWREPAERIAASGKPTRILYDPAHPEHIVLVDALVNSGEE